MFFMSLPLRNINRRRKPKQSDTSALQKILCRTDASKVLKEGGETTETHCQSLPAPDPVGGNLHMNRLMVNYDLLRENAEPLRNSNVFYGLSTCEKLPINLCRGEKQQVALKASKHLI